MVLREFLLVHWRVYGESNFPFSLPICQRIYRSFIDASCTRRSGGPALVSYFKRP